MYKNLLKACALAVFAMGSMESAEAMNQMGDGGGQQQNQNAERLPDVNSKLQSDVDAKVEAFIEAAVFGEKFDAKLLQNMKPQKPTFQKTVKINVPHNIKVTAGNTNASQEFVVVGTNHHKELAYKVDVSFGDAGSKTFTKATDAALAIDQAAEKELKVVFSLVDDKYKTSPIDEYKTTVQIELVAQ
ncbi:MAG: hypothetical protein IJA14_03510 [Alphaproteobacteria bacterium]|nr:hypothetical protein [Alphaproteobacteria bacterium]